MKKYVAMSTSSLMSKESSRDASLPNSFSRAGKYARVDDDDDSADRQNSRAPSVATSNEEDQGIKVVAMEKANGTKRRPVGDQTLRHRIGPAPVSDRILKVSIDNTAPGSLDSDMEDLNFDDEKIKSKAGCKGLLMYFSKLGKSAEDGNIDFTFIESLLNGGADINFCDRHGQCALHEIARGWNLAAADFARLFGANVNSTDRHGRSPLHLASAVNHHEMVTWLLEHGAMVDAKTRGENQTPIHYAAKNNAVDALKVLLKLGADIGSRDYKNRTPLFVAAETGRSEACRFLLEQGAPAGVYDDGGTSALTLMVEKMPDVAKIALGQFQMVDKALRKKFYYLNYLETDVWRRMATREGKALRISYARTPLETICIYNENDLIMHPVILRLIAIKWQLFGKYHSIITTAINLVYTLLWTTLGVTLPKTQVKNYYTPVKENMWRTVLEVISCGMSLVFLVMQVLEFRRSDKRDRQYKEWRTREVERDLQYCHPRWPEERRYLSSEMDLIRSSSLSYLKNGWNIFEWVAFSVILLVICTRIASCVSDNPMADNIHYRAFLILLILLWLRFMKCCRCYQSLGPFITMLGHVIADTMKFAFLFFEFFIPYVCAFWILFGGIPNSEFENINDLIYQVFLMTLVANFEPEAISRHDKVMTQILIGTYMAIASVVCLNLYIALMSETFNRVYSNAKATAYMLQANHLLNIERSLGRKQRNRVKRYMATECSPQVIYDTGSGDDESDEAQRLLMYRMNQGISEIRDRLMLINSSDEKRSDDGFSVQKIAMEIDQLRRKQCEQDNVLTGINTLLEKILCTVISQHDWALPEEPSTQLGGGRAVTQEGKRRASNSASYKHTADAEQFKTASNMGKERVSNRHSDKLETSSFVEDGSLENARGSNTPSMQRDTRYREQEHMHNETMDKRRKSNHDQNESDFTGDDLSDATKTCSDDDSTDSVKGQLEVPSYIKEAKSIEYKTRDAKDHDATAKKNQRSTSVPVMEHRASTLPRNTPNHVGATRQLGHFSTLPKKSSIQESGHLRSRSPQTIPSKSSASIKGSPMTNLKNPQIRVSNENHREGLVRSRENRSRPPINNHEEVNSFVPDHVFGDYELTAWNDSNEEAESHPRRSSGSHPNSSRSHQGLNADRSTGSKSRRQRPQETSARDSEHHRAHSDYAKSPNFSSKKTHSPSSHGSDEDERTPLYGSPDELEDDPLESSKWRKVKRSLGSIHRDIEDKHK